MSQCRGKIRRSYGEYPCDQNAVYAVRSGERVTGTCRQHLAQEVDAMGAPIVEVIRVGEF